LHQHHCGDPRIIFRQGAPGFFPPRTRATRNKRESCGLKRGQIHSTRGAHVNDESFFAYHSFSFPIDSWQINMSFENTAKEYLILGTDARDIEEQKQRWLVENPQIEVIGSGDVRPEPASLLIRLGGKRVPRFSVLLQYRETDATRQVSAATGLSLAAAGAGQRRQA
jgi:hypothetical protein